MEKKKINQYQTPLTHKLQIIKEHLPEEYENLIKLMKKETFEEMARRFNVKIL